MDCDSSSGPNLSSSDPCIGPEPLYSDPRGGSSSLPEPSVFDYVLDGHHIQLSPDAFLDSGTPESTELDPQETSVGPPPKSYREYMRLRNSNEVKATDEALDIWFAGRSSEIKERYENCRKQAFFFRNKTTGHVKVVGQSCRQRWCYLCGRSKARELSRRLAEWLKVAKKPKFLTLTLRHSKAPLKDQLDALYRHFRNLRMHSITKKALKAGHWSVQLTYNAQTGEWHPHIHALVIGKWLSNRVLSHIWREVTHGSYIVDCKYIKNIHSPKVRDKAAWYVARYVSRPCPMADIPLEKRLEMIQAFHSRRLHNSWGKLAKEGLPPREKFDYTVWSPIGSWQKVIEGLSDNPICREIWKAWKSGSAVAESVTLEPAAVAALPAVPPPRPPTQAVFEDWTKPKTHYDMR
jgi:hypothetical protein